MTTSRESLMSATFIGRNLSGGHRTHNSTRPRPEHFLLRPAPDQLVPDPAGDQLPIPLPRRRQELGRVTAGPNGGGRWWLNPCPSGP